MAKVHSKCESQIFPLGIGAFQILWLCHLCVPLIEDQFDEGVVEIEPASLGIPGVGHGDARYFKYSGLRDCSQINIVIVFHYL